MVFIANLLRDPAATASDCQMFEKLFIKNRTIFIATLSHSSFSQFIFSMVNLPNISHAQTLGSSETYASEPEPFL